MDTKNKHWIDRIGNTLNDEEVGRDRDGLKSE